MSTGLTHGLPVVLFVLVVVLYLRSGKKPEPYRLSQQWTREPILWSAADEVIPTSGGPVNVGGGASGNW